MKTAIVFTAVLLLSFTPASGQIPGDVYLSSVTGLGGTGILIESGSTTTVDFVFNYRNNDAAKVKGWSNGFEFSGSDSSVTWVLSYSLDPSFPEPWIWYCWTPPWWHGVGSDTIGYGNTVIVGAGLPFGFDGPVLNFSVAMSDTASVGGTFCIDSAWYPPDGIWMWAFGTHSTPPTWDGPHCFEISSDLDGDGALEPYDNCPGMFNPGQLDSDADGIGDSCDNCLSHMNTAQSDLDADGYGDSCDACPLDPENDFDGDGVCGDIDNCPHNPNPSQVDADENGIGDVCQPGCCLNRGDVNRSGGVSPIDISDLIHLAEYMFTSGYAPSCIEEADINGSGGDIDIADLVHLVDYMFNGGLPPADCP